MPLADLLRRVRAGEPDACREMVEHYSHLLRTMIRTHLHVRLRSVYEPDDVLQSVWRVFFANEVMARDFATPEQLLAFLISACQNKAGEYHRKELDAQKRDHRRAADLPAEVPDRAPGPEQLAIADDEWLAFVKRYSPQIRQAFAMLRDGHSHAEVAKAVGISERHIQRIIVEARIKLRGRAGV